MRILYWPSSVYIILTHGLVIILIAARDSTWIYEYGFGNRYIYIYIHCISIMKNFVNISNGKTEGIGFGNGFTQAQKYESVLEHVNIGYKSDSGISWKKGNKLFHSEDMPQYSNEQFKQIKKYGEIVEGSKKPKYGYKREITVWENEK